MKLSDYVVDFVHSLGVEDVFLMTGGAIAHIVDSVAQKSLEKDNFRYICVQHEQSAAMAVEAYARLHRSGIGVAFATSGPGATNFITGMCGCWFDSIPSLFISGQVSTRESIDSISTKPRQVGFQETDIVTIVSSITKYAEKVTDPLDIRYHLEKAVYFAKEGRPGPVLLDIPVDIQVAEINPSALRGFLPDKKISGNKLDSENVVLAKIEKLRDLLKKAERPIILLGAGVRLGGAEKEIISFIEKLGVPVVVSWGAFDILSHDHPLFIGHIGVYGNRGANFAAQNADLLISIGSRLDTRQTGGRVESFAREAKKVMVDIDKNEIEKGRGLVINLGIHTDVKYFLKTFSKLIEKTDVGNIAKWLERVVVWKTKYPAVLPEFHDQKEISSYVFIKKLSDVLRGGEVVVVDEGGNLVWTMQSFSIKKEQRLFSTFGNSPMGYALPASIGASVALGRASVICIDGDGGFQPNIQELQTIKHYNLPIKIFIMNNRSMGIIKQFQDLYFDSRYYATTSRFGYSAPDFVAVAKAYGIDAFSIKDFSEIDSGIKRVIDHNGPILCDVWIDEDQKLNPKLEFGRPLEDMSPYLPREEFLENMVIEPLPESKEIPKKTGWQIIS